MKPSGSCCNQTLTGVLLPPTTQTQSIRTERKKHTGAEREWERLRQHYYTYSKINGSAFKINFQMFPISITFHKFTVSLNSRRLKTPFYVRMCSVRVISDKWEKKNIKVINVRNTKTWKVVFYGNGYSNYN